MIQKSYSSAQTSSNSTSWTNPTVTGNLLVACVNWLTNAVSPVVTAPSGWIQTVQSVGPTTSVGSNTPGCTIFYILGAASRSGSESFSISATGRYVSITLLEYNKGTTLDRTAVNNNTSTTLDSGTTGTLTVANEIAVASLISYQLSGGSVSTPTLGSPSNGFTVEKTNASSGFSSAFFAFGETIADKGTYSNSGVNTSVTSNSSYPWAGAVTTFVISASNLFNYTAFGGLSSGGTALASQLTVIFNYTASGGLNLGGGASASQSGSGGNNTFEIIQGFQFNHYLNKLLNPYIDSSEALQRLKRLLRIQR